MNRIPKPATFKYWSTFELLEEIEARYRTFIFAGIDALGGISFDCGGTPAELLGLSTISDNRVQDVADDMMDDDDGDSPGGDKPSGNVPPGLLARLYTPSLN